MNKKRAALLVGILLTGLAVYAYGLTESYNAYTVGSVLAAIMFFSYALFDH